MAAQGEKDFRSLRREVGYAFQDPDDQLFSLTVAEDVAFGPLNLGKSRQEARQQVSDTWPPWTWPVMRTG